MLKCLVCDTENRTGAKFCGDCGAPLPAAAPRPLSTNTSASAPIAPPPPTPSPAGPAQSPYGSQPQPQPGPGGAQHPYGGPQQQPYGQPQQPYGGQQMYGASPYAPRPSSGSNAGYVIVIVLAIMSMVTSLVTIAISESDSSSSAASDLNTWMLRLTPTYIPWRTWDIFQYLDGHGKFGIVTLWITFVLLMTGLIGALAKSRGLTAVCALLCGIGLVGLCINAISITGTTRTFENFGVQLITMATSAVLLFVAFAKLQSGSSTTP